MVYIYYALVCSKDDTGTGCHRLFFGYLAGIARDLIDQCSNSILWEDIEDRTLEDFAEEECDAGLDSLCSIYNNPNPTEEDIRNFDFDYSGERTIVVALTSSYPDLVEAFNKYSEKGFWGEFHMVQGNITDPDTLREVDGALVSIYDLPSPYFIEAQ